MVAWMSQAFVVLEGVKQLKKYVGRWGKLHGGQAGLEGWEYMRSGSL